MAPRKSSQGSSPGAARRASARTATSSLNGTWAFRFGGYAMYQVRPWWLSGLGKLTISQNGKTLRGTQRSSVTPIQGQETDTDLGVWDLEGTIAVGSDGQ